MLRRYISAVTIAADILYLTYRAGPASPRFRDGLHWYDRSELHSPCSVDIVFYVAAGYNRYYPNSHLATKPSNSAPTDQDSTSAQGQTAFDEVQTANDVVSSSMTCGEIFDLLMSRGCSDLTPWLDERSCSQYPVSTGGYGDVFRAKLTNGHEVAIKTIRIYDNNGTSEGRYAKHAAREIYAWSKCNHLNVVQLVGIIVFRGFLAMVSWWAGNGNVVSYLNRWPNVSRCQTSLSICTGLAYLHEQDIVHGDLKGANVLVGHDGNPMLADFGNASIADATLQFTQTAAGPSFSPRWTASGIAQ
ncbi:unnamed protein product [Rhizoctonia solani]|uniref:Protein kinase domain-containing protein n=1 Tax=Rhizoctonia solani TaxID=456999 RepID=A0A8H2X870_9AGAM|nr:unnamed protein product [Rhizoctonia solani]